MHSTNASDNTDGATHEDATDLLTTIPTELVLDICQYLTQRVRFRLAQASKKLSQLIITEMYCDDAKIGDRYALWWAVVKGRKGALETILRRDPAAVHVYFEKGHRIANAGPRFGRNQTALLLACRVQNARAVNLLLDNGASAIKPDKYPVAGHSLCWYPINWVITNNMQGKASRIIHALSQHGADMDVRPTAWCKPKEEATAPEQEDAAPEEEAIAPVPQLSAHITIAQDEVAPVFDLLRLGEWYIATDNLIRAEGKKVSAKYVDQDFGKRLDYALAALRMLLARGADPNSRNAYNHTPLTYIISQLHAWKARFPFPRAAVFRHEEEHQYAMLTQKVWCFIDALVYYGADLNKTDLKGRTPLHLACTLDERHRMIRDNLVALASVRR
ncbi:Uu.00g026000.m01.CDS01 [Anthostomella pinea]|uniref:Uu.00g026000.m01.CDS01 n=1 Tax=Anthostomella pinea TaxID=933095 RepID=A0AAI8V7Y9_9PEZI|nr:Uu.00g026000.m01.CDS01 [Anthostomella pinea]